MSLPPIAPVPPANLRREIGPEEWEACLDAWIALCQAHLRLPAKDFSAAVQEDGQMVRFVTSYFREIFLASNDPSFRGDKASSLKRQCFLVLHRILSGDAIPSSFLEWAFLSRLSHVFPRSESLRRLLQGVWERRQAEIIEGLQNVKNDLIASLESGKPEKAANDLRQLGRLLHVSPDAGAFFMTGSDFLDSLCSAYVSEKASADLRTILVAVTYVGLLALTPSPRPNYSLLSDHLYTLKSNAEVRQKTKPDQPTLLSDLVSNTPILNKIRDCTTAQEGNRARNLVASLDKFRKSNLVRPKRRFRRKIDKGKSRAEDDEYGHGAFENVHVHRMSLISQIHDLFPDLGSGFIIKLLDEYNDDVEQVTTHLLDDSLPPRLRSADRGEQINFPPASHLPPRYTPPPQRRNVFDYDEFDRLAVDASRLHIGKKNEKLTADAILSDRSQAPDKAAILSALAAFDMDDDERDDTYDIADVGGTVDTSAPADDEAAEIARDKNEEALFKAYTSSPAVFQRDAATRRGQARLALKSETGMTDEAIEGWAVMLARDPRRLKRLEMKFTAFSGQQMDLPRTAYRESPADSGEEHLAEDAGRGGRGGFRGRGRGGGRGGRGSGRGGGSGNVAGTAGDKDTQGARQRKEASKGSRANHNRRDQRARKVARAGFSG